MNHDKNLLIVSQVDINTSIDISVDRRARRGVIEYTDPPQTFIFDAQVSGDITSPRINTYFLGMFTCLYLHLPHR